MLAEISRFVNWVHRRNPKARTWRDYKYDLNLFAASVGYKQLKDVTVRDIDNFINDQVSRGLKATTINRRTAAIVSLYTFFTDDYPALVCPVLTHRHNLREPQRLPRPVSAKDIRKFFAVIDHVRDRAMFMLMIMCGLRISEVAQLILPDLFLDEKNPRFVVQGKSGRERSCYLSPAAERSLREYLSTRPAAKNDYVFLSYQLKGLSTTAIHQRLMRYRKLSGVYLTAHQLRHAFASQLVEAEVPVTSIQKLLGHRWLETTQIYIKANDKQVKSDFYNACQKLEGWS